MKIYNMYEVECLKCKKCDYSNDFTGIGTTTKDDIPFK